MKPLIHNPLTYAFTVIELMMVIAILGAMFAISVPSIERIREKALNRRAQLEATALAQAAIRYKHEYGFWPGQLEVINDTSDNVKYHKDIPLDDKELLLIISGPKEFTDTLKAESGQEATKMDQLDSSRLLKLNSNEVYRAFARVRDAKGTRNPLNPRAINFLDLKDDTEFDRVTFVDPWGNPYILFEGLNPRTIFGHIVNTTINGATYTQTLYISNTVAFAFSRGAEGARSTNFIYSAGVKNEKK